MAVLNLGLNYALPIENNETSALEMIMSVDKILCEINDEDCTQQTKDTVKNEVRHALKSSLQKGDFPKTPKWMINAIKSIRQDKSIIITKADKGNTTVIMDREDYDNKMDSLINEGPYDELSMDPIPDYQKRVKKACIDLLNGEKIDKTLYTTIRPEEGKCPVLYGLPKLHKPNIPMRPITDYRYTPGYKLSIFLKSVLKCISSRHDYTLKNTYDFVDRIREVKLEQMETMASFDVTSLFTNVPTKETVAIVMVRLQNNSNWKRFSQNLSLTDIFNLLNLVTENFITWRGRYFKQNKGTPMGSPLSPLLAEIFLQNMETQIIPRIPHLKLWVRMVDDVYAIFRKRKEVEILSALNNHHADLKFTIEEEKNGTLNFLDVSLTRKEDGSLSRNVFRKSTHTDRYLDWTSHHHRSQKIAVIDSFTMRALKICDEDSLHQELRRIETCLAKNGYPRKTILGRIEYLQNRPPRAPRINSEFDAFEERKWCAIPYIGQVTYQIAGIIRTYLERDLGYYTGIKLSKQLCNFKDKIPSVPCGVYKIFCNCNVVYIGETNNLDRRKKDHDGDLKFKRIDKSALAEHEDNYPSHKVVTDSIVLLHYEKRNFQRKFKEAISIQKYPNNMNRSTGHDIGSWLPLALNWLNE